MNKLKINKFSWNIIEMSPQDKLLHRNLERHENTQHRITAKIHFPGLERTGVKTGRDT